MKTTKTRPEGWEKNTSIIRKVKFKRIFFRLSADLNEQTHQKLIALAADFSPSLRRRPNSLGGLNIGCGSNSVVGTFFSGLIDDVRIYNSGYGVIDHRDLFVFCKYWLTEKK